jgi:hypothetical protein
MAKPEILWPLAAEAHFNPSPIHVGFVLDKEAWEKFLYEYFGIPLSV